MEEVIAVASADNKYYMLTENNYELKAYTLDESKVKDEFYIAFNNVLPANIKVLKNVDTDTVNFMKKVYLNSLCDTYEQAVKRRAKNKLLGLKLKDDIGFSKLMFQKLRLTMYKCRDTLSRDVIFLYNTPYRTLEDVREINTRALRRLKGVNSIDELKGLFLIYTTTFRDICGKEIYELFIEIIDYYSDFDVDEIIIVTQNSLIFTFGVGLKDSKFINENCIWMSEYKTIERKNLQIGCTTVDELKEAYSSEVYSIFSIKSRSITLLKE